MPGGGLNGLCSVDGMSVVGQNQPESQELFCAEIRALEKILALCPDVSNGYSIFENALAPTPERPEPSKTEKNSAPQFEIEADWGAAILIRSN